MNKVYISFGSNMGDRYKAVREALALIESHKMKITKKSGLYETEPYGYTNQPPFINGAAEILTDLSGREVLKSLMSIEEEMGRVREFKWGPRIIDLDIIFFNNEICNEADLKIPHPDMQNRAFVLKPLTELCPDYVHPVYNKTISQLLKELESK